LIQKLISFYKSQFDVISLFIFATINSFLTFLLPKITIFYFDVSMYANFVIYTTIANIFYKISLIDISDLILKKQYSKKFLENINIFFLLNFTLYLFFIFFYFVIETKSTIFKILIFANFLAIIFRYVNLVQFQKNLLKIYNFSIILQNVLIYIILIIFYNLKLEYEFNLIIAFLISTLIILCINSKIIMKNLNFAFNIVFFKKNIFRSFKLVKENLYYVLNLTLKSIYLPFLILMIQYISKNNEAIISISGISLAISMFAGNIIFRIFYKYNLVNTNNNDKNLIIYAYLGIIFYIAIYILGFYLIEDFYFQKKIDNFNTIYSTFIIIGFVNYLFELKFHKIVEENRIFILFFYNFIKLVTTIILFIFCIYFKSSLSFLIVTNSILFTLISIYFINKFYKFT
jgi:hypothetical protein